MASMQEQLLKAGIVDKKSAKKINHEKRKQKKKQGKSQVNETRELAKQVLAEKSARDKAINKQQQAEAEKKAIHAQVVQLINLNRIDRAKGDTPYQFADGTQIKKIYVTDLLLNQLDRGRIAIVKLNDTYELIPAAIADKIKQREENTIVLHHIAISDETVEEDDPYAAFKIPDDLMW